MKEKMLDRFKFPEELKEKLVTLVVYQNRLPKDLSLQSAAWITIKRRNVQAHRQFMIRSYTLTLAFVFLRILSDLVYKHNFLSFIKNQEVKDATYEWMSWVVPVLIVELLISWLPLIKKNKSSIAGR